MKIQTECIPCLLKRIIFEAEQSTSDKKLQMQAIQNACKVLSEIYDPNDCSATIATKVHKIVYETLGNEDPYSDLKNKSNAVAQSLLPKVEELIQNSEDPLKISMICSIIGNMMDFGIEGGSAHPDMLKDDFEKTYQEGLGYDGYPRLKKLLKNAKHVVLFTDNCGEIVFDKLLCRELKKFNPSTFLTIVVKGEKILSDATIEDAHDLKFEEVVDESSSTQDTRTALLFGLSQLIVGFSSGMVIPYFIPWIYAAFEPDPVILGSIPAIANLTLASGTLLVGLSSERVGKLKMIFILNLLAPILTFGIVYIPYFLIMIVFYIARQTVANMSRPAFNSLFMGEITTSRRGRSLAVTRVLWQFPRQTGTLTTAFILGFFGGIVPFGLIVFPIAMIMYPISTIPLYIAVRRNRMQKEQIDFGSTDL